MYKKCFMDSQESLDKLKVIRNEIEIQSHLIHPNIV